MRDVRMWWFHARQFARNSYFMQLLLTSTCGMVALQALAARNPEAVGGTGFAAPGLGWLRAGMLGNWTMCGVAIGLLGYQRFQDTYVHLVRTPHQAIRTLFPVVGAASVFGLLALPLAAITALALRQPVTFGNRHMIGQLLAAGFLFWLACLAVSTALGMVFVLTPNAITYQPLIGIPLILVSGIFGTPEWIPDWIIAIATILPTRGAVALLVSVVHGDPVGWQSALAVIISSLLWLIIAGWLANRVANASTKSGTLEVI